MPSKTNIITIDKNRLDIVLKHKGITYRQLSEAINYNHTSLSRALRKGTIDITAFTAIKEKLGVSPDFLEGYSPLYKLKEDKKEEFRLNLVIFDIPGVVTKEGIYIPYEWVGDEYQTEIIKKGDGERFLRDEESNKIIQLYVELDKSGVNINEEEDSRVELHYDPDFVIKNAGYLVPQVRTLIKNSLLSAFNKDEAYEKWEQMQGYHEREDTFFDYFEKVPEDQEPDE